MDNLLRTQIEDHLPRIRGIVSRIARDQGMVDDLTQETCLRLIEKEALWKPERGGLIQWINAVTRNLAIRQVKRRRDEDVRRRSLVGDITMEAPDRPFDEDQIAWVLGQFGSLPEAQRQILHLHYFERKTLTAIGEELDISRQVVSYQLHKALRTLRQRAGVPSQLALLLPWNWDIQGWGLRLQAALAEQGGPLMIFKTTLALALVGGITAVAINEYSPENTGDSPAVANATPDRVSLPDAGGTTAAGDSTLPEAEASAVNAGHETSAVGTTAPGDPEASGDTAENKTSPDEDIYIKLGTYVYQALKDSPEHKDLFDRYYSRRRGLLPQQTLQEKMQELSSIFHVDISLAPGFNGTGDITMHYGERRFAHCLNEICEILSQQRDKEEMDDRWEIAWFVRNGHILIGVAHDNEDFVHASRDNLEKTVAELEQRRDRDRRKATEAFLDTLVTWDLEGVGLRDGLRDVIGQEEMPLGIHTDKLALTPVTTSGAGSLRQFLDALVESLADQGPISWILNEEGHIWIYDRDVVEQQKAEERRRHEEDDNTAD